MNLRNKLSKKEECIKELADKIEKSRNEIIRIKTEVNF